MTTQLTTFSDLYNDLLKRVRIGTSDTYSIAEAKKYINIALHDMFLGFGDKFSFAERDAVLQTRPSYSTGTVDVTIGSTTVTGNSTAWNTADSFGTANVRAGGKMSINGNVYEVSAVASDTSLTLVTNYIGATDTTVSYVYYEDTYSLAADYLKPIDFRRFSGPMDIPLMSRTEFRRAWPRNNTVGKPSIATIIDTPTASDATIPKKIQFHRPPDKTYLIPYTYVTSYLAVSTTGTEQTQLSADTDEPIVPLMARHAIVLGALKSWYRDKKDDQRSQEAAADYVDVMTRLIGDNDTGAAPKPQIIPRLGGYAAKAKRPFRSGRYGRYVAGSAFDEIR